VCGLAVVFERAGLPTTTIALVREHAERMHPPRALWVPFGMGRPFGAPDAPALQRHVVETALGLLEQAGQDPLLVDFLQDAPTGDAREIWRPAAELSAGALPAEGAEPEALAEALRREAAVMLPRHAAAAAAHQRTTTGASGQSTESCVALVAGCLTGEDPPETPGGLSGGMLLKLAAEDIHAAWCEAAAHGSSPSADALASWYWRETAAGRAVRALNRRLEGHKNRRLRTLSDGLLVPGM